MHAGAFEAGADDPLAARLHRRSPPAGSPARTRDGLPRAPLGPRTPRVRDRYRAWPRSRSHRLTLGIACLSAPHRAQLGLAGLGRAVGLLATPPFELGRTH